MAPDLMMYMAPPGSPFRQITATFSAKYRFKDGSETLKPEYGG